MTADENSLSLPPRWGKDCLSFFVSNAFTNCLATFVNKKPQYNVLLQIDQCFMKVGENLINPTDELAALLLLRSHSAYRAACRLALSGQATDSFPSLRSCIEYGLYALHINQNPNLGEIWLRRHDNEEAKKLSRQSFPHVEVAKSLKVLGAKLHETIEKLYERTIDFGAHPNEMAITGSMTITEKEGRKEYAQIYLHADSLALEHVLKTTAQVGLGSLCIFYPIFKEKFDLLGIRDTIDELKKIL